MMATCINGITAGNLDCFYYVKISVAKREKQERKKNLCNIQDSYSYIRNSIENVSGNWKAMRVNPTLTFAFSLKSVVIWMHLWLFAAAIDLETTHDLQLLWAGLND